MRDDVDLVDLVRRLERGRDHIGERVIITIAPMASSVQASMRPGEAARRCRQGLAASKGKGPVIARASA